jgi:hypothetical protein
MQLGKLVNCKTYPEKGFGTVIEIKTFAGMEQAVVFFEKVREKLLLKIFTERKPTSGP